MPSIADSLHNLATQSEQINYHSSQNLTSAGPFVHALLGNHNILSLIRDAVPAEARLFKFIGEESGGNKKVEKRDDGLVTPLKAIQRGGGAKDNGKEQVGVMLKTAMRLVDDYHSMPRARRHIQELLDEHEMQVDRVAELERLIQEATNPTAGSSSAKSSAKAPAKRTLTIDEAIRAEEAALRRLESHVVPHRDQPDPSPSAPPSSRSAFSATTPPRPTSPPPFQSLPSQTPAKTPSAIPHIANSLVNGATPRRPVQPTLNRFSPLKLLGTPRAPAAGSILRSHDADAEPRTIFSRASMLRNSTTSLGRSVSTPAAKPQQEEETEDETVRFPKLPVESSPDKTAIFQGPPSPDKLPEFLPETEVEDTLSVPPVEPPVHEPEPVDLGPRKVEGVIVESRHVKHGTDRIWAAVPDMMRQGLKDGTEISNDIESTVKHVHRIAQSDPSPPPSPSDASSLSSLAAAAGSKPRASPIEPQTILFAHLLLLLLRSTDGNVPLPHIKEKLGTIARARGWDDADAMANTAFYAGVGKRVWKIDRRAGGGGQVSFNA